MASLRERESQPRWIDAFCGSNRVVGKLPSFPFSPYVTDLSIIIRIEVLDIRLCLVERGKENPS